MELKEPGSQNKNEKITNDDKSFHKIISNLDFACPRLEVFEFYHSIAKEEPATEGECRKYTHSCSNIQEFSGLTGYLFAEVKALK